MSSVFIPGFRPTTRKGGSKYNSTHTMQNGLKFDSKAEALRYSQLERMLRAGVIKRFSRQPSFIISEADGKTLRYRPDFIVWDGCNVWVEDVKSQGTITKEFKVKFTVFKEKYPYIELRVIDKNGEEIM